MRLRHVKNANEKLAANEKYVILNPLDYVGKWNVVFGNDHPIHIEIGMGKGQFITELAKRNPNINYIGIELFSSVLVRASEKLEEASIPNLKLLLFDANKIDELFWSQEISKIYLNFSDPWPKKAHAKRRLTSPGFLDKYQKVLRKEGNIEFKTDNRKLFEYSLLVLHSHQIIISDLSLDLHKEERADNILTEYEEKFSKHGPIYFIRFTFKEKE